MVNIAANMTQVLTNSPQVTTLVAGEAGAIEQIKRQKQIEESRRLEEEMRSKVLLSERALRAGESEEEARQRLSERSKRLAVSEEPRQGRQRARKTAARDEREAEAAPSGCAPSPFEAQQVIDVCV